MLWVGGGERCGVDGMAIVANNASKVKHNVIRGVLTGSTRSSVVFTACTRGTCGTGRF